MTHSYRAEEEMTRRQALSGIAAATASPWLLNWSAEDSAGDNRQRAGHRMQLLVLKSNHEGAARIIAQFGTDLHSIVRDGKSIYGLLIWISAAGAGRLSQEPAVEAVHPIMSKDIVETGDPKTAGGKLAVKVGPGDWKKPPASGTYRTRQQIVDEWSQKLATVAGVTVKSIQVEEVTTTCGGIATHESGQILVSYAGDACPAEVLRLLRSDPQVYCLHWGDPSRDFSRAVFCGRG